MIREKNIQRNLLIAFGVLIALFVLGVSSFGQSLNPTVKSIKLDSIRARQDTIWLTDNKGGVAYLFTKNDSLVFGDVSGEKYLALMATGGTPGGTPGEIQYNNAGNFDGASIFADGNGGARFGTGDDSINIGDGIFKAGAGLSYFSIGRSDSEVQADFFSAIDGVDVLSAYSTVSNSDAITATIESVGSSALVINNSASDTSLLIKNGNNDVFRIDSDGMIYFDDNSIWSKGVTYYPTSGLNSLYYDANGDSLTWAPIGETDTIDIEYRSLVLGAGTTTRAPLKLTTQASGLTSVQQGAFELIGNSLHFTNLAVRRTVVQAEEVLLSNVSVANTATETTIYTVPHGANYLEVGKMEDIILQGTISSVVSGAANTLTIRFKYGGTTYATYIIVEATRAALNIELHSKITCRAIGSGTTSIQIHCRSEIDNEVNDATVNVLATGLNSTTEQPFTITAQWSDADAGNVLTVLQGSTICIDDNK